MILNHFMLLNTEMLEEVDFAQLFFALSENLENKTLTTNEKRK